jgi:hypothetical protein
VTIGQTPNVSVTVPELARLENVLGTALDEHRDTIITQLARILVAMAVEEHHGTSNGNGRPAGPKRCTICGGLAAPQRTVCNACRKRQQRERERLRRAHGRELEAAARGERGERARELVLGARADPAQP